MNLIEYEQHVRSLASRRDGQPIFNASVEHASIVIQNLFSEARGSVDILSGNCDARVFGRRSVVEEAMLFLASSAKNRLRIILEEDHSEDREIHPFFKMCSELPNAELRIASRAVQELYGFHFIVADDDSYRYEDDKTTAEAIAAFGHREGAENLSGIYNYLWGQCMPVDIIPAQT